jgi:hypothetical protein
MSRDRNNSALKKSAGLSTVALAVAALLANSSAPAQSSLGETVGRAKQTSIHPSAKCTPPLIIQPSASVIQLGHSSHASHASHYSSSAGSGGDAPAGDTPGGGASQDNPPPAPPATPPPPPQKPVGSPEWVPDTSYPYIVDMNDGREIRCDVQDDGDYYNLVKRAGKIRVLKTDVKSIQRSGGPATQPTTQPTSEPSR